MTGFVPPEYPYERLSKIKELAAAGGREAVDLSVGTPTDPPPPMISELLATSQRERGYPPSLGALDVRSAAARWLTRRFGVDLSPSAIGLSIGSKEFIASLPRYLKLRTPARNVVLYPAISYPTYEVGALLGGCEPYPVPVMESGGLDFSSIPESVVRRALMLWVNAPSNPTGKTSGIAEAARFGAEHNVVVASDECYCDFLWSSAPKSILSLTQSNVLAVHSLSKRSNLAGLRVGTYSGDIELVSYLSEVRKHGGMMVPGPVQSAAVGAYDDESHVEAQRARYFERLDMLRESLVRLGFEVEMPEGGIYLWFKAPTPTLRNGFLLAEFFARQVGMIVSPGEFYGRSSADYVRLAVVAPTQAIATLCERLDGVQLPEG